MHGHLVIVLAAAVLIVLLQAPNGDAECCGTWYSYSKDGDTVKRCADCTRPSPTWYCSEHNSKTGCNLFGCGCVCRKETDRQCSYDCCDSIPAYSRSRRDVDSAAISMPTGNYTGHDVIMAGDLDKNGHLDEVEVHLYLTQRGVPVDDVIAWRRLDSNDDDKLTAAEIDADLLGSDDVTAV